MMMTKAQFPEILILSLWMMIVVAVSGATIKMRTCHEKKEYLGQGEDRKMWEKGYCNQDQLEEQEVKDNLEDIEHEFYPRTYISTSSGGSQKEPLQTAEAELAAELRERVSGEEKRDAEVEI